MKRRPLPSFETPARTALRRASARQIIGAAAWALAGLSVAAFYSQSAQGATTYTLNGPITSGSASWTQTGVWTGGVVASGSGNGADFSENLLTGNLTITLDGNQTIGGLWFGDQGSTFSTTLASGAGGVITLSVPSGAPVVNVVNGVATISATIAGTSGLNKTGAGNLTLTAANTYTGATTVSGGTLTLDFSQVGAPTNDIISNSIPASLVLTGGSTLAVTGDPFWSNSQTFGSLTVGSGANVITLNENSATSLTAALGAITQSGGGTLNFSVAPLTSGVVATTGNSLANGLLGPWATVGTGVATQYATINSSGQIVGYTGASAGGANLVSVTSATTNYTFSAVATLAGARTANTLQYTGAAATTALGANTLTLNGLLNTGSGLLSITRTGTGGLVIGANKELVILGPGSVTISAPIANNSAGASSLTYSGTGALTLGGAVSTYTGTTTVDSGTVTLALANVLNSASSVVVNGGVLGYSTFAQSVSSVSLLGGSITGTAALTSATGFNLQSGAVAAVLAGSGGITKTTSGSVTISGAGTVAGGVTIKAGTIKIGVANALPTGSAVILGDAVANTGGTLNLSGFAQTILSLSSAGSGPSLVTNSSATTPVTLSVAGVGTSAFGGVIQDGPASGGVAVSLSGGGTGTFTGANTYTGLTLVQNYNLTLTGGNNRLAATAPFELNNNGVLHLGDATGASNQTFSSLFVGTLGTLNRVVGGNATQTSTLTINNFAADAYQGYLGSGAADTTAVTLLNDLALTKTGPGTLTLGGGAATLVSTYDGGTNINQGTLALGIANALPAAKTLTFNGGTLTSGAVNINGGTLDLAGFNSVAGVVTLAGGSIVDSGAAAALNGSGYIVQSGAVNAVLGGVGTLTKTTAGTVTLSAANTYTGGTNVSAGTLVLGAANALPGTGTANITGGTLALGAANGLAADGALNVNGGTLDLAGFASGAGPLTLTSGSVINSGGAGASLSASSYNVQSGSMSAVIGGALSSLTKSGSGTVTLSAANTYGGATDVNGGILNITAAQTGGGAFSVNDGATLGVSLTAASQTLNASSLTLGAGSGATITLNLGSFGSATAPVINASSLTLNGTDVLNISAGGLSVGEFPLIAYTGSIAGAGSLTLGALPARVVATLDATSISNLVQLDVTGYDYPKWTGGVNGNWDLDPTGAGQQGTLNWVTAIGGVATRYLQGTGGTDSVLFDDSAAATATIISGATTVNLTTTLTPVNVTVNNSALNYIFGGSGSLSGATSLLKEGSGTLTIANTGGNNYTGATTISAGTVQVGDGSTPGAGQLGSGSVSISLGASLVLDRPIGDNFTVVNALSGAGALVQKGGDTVTLTGNSLSFGGTFDVTSGTLAVGSANALGTAAGAVESGATLDVSGFSIGNVITVNGGTLQASSGSGGTIGGQVTLNGGGIGNVTAGSTLTISGAIGGSGGFAKNGSGLLILSGNNTYSGLTTINAGTVQIGSGGVRGTLGGNSVIDNGTLVFDRSDSYGGPVSNTISGNGGLTVSAGTLSLPGANTYAGVTNIDGGVLNVGILAGVNTASSIGAGSAGGSAADLALGGGALQYTGTSPASTCRLFTIGDANGNSATIDSSAASPANTLIFTGTGALAFTNTAPHTLTLTGSNTGANTFLPVIGNFSSAYTTNIIKSGSGTWTVSGANTFTGGVTIQAGTLKLGVAEALGNNLNTLTLGNSATNTGGTLDLNGKTQILVTLLSAGSGQSIITNSSPTAATLELTAAGSVFGGVIQDGAIAGGVVVLLAGGGSAVFTGANTYTGLTTVQNYNLTLTGGDNRLSTSDPVVLNNGGVLHLGDTTGASNQTVSSLTAGASGTTNRVVGGNATLTSTLTVNNSAADAYQSYLGSGTADTTVVTLLNDLALTKTGPGTLTLGGGTLTTTISTYDGATNINQGTLALGIANALPAAKTLTFGSGTLTTGAVNINGGTLDLAGFSTVAGVVTLTTGSIGDSGAAATLTGSSYAVQSGTVSATLGGAGALTKTTAGTVTISGANTYSGGTNVSAGTLILGAANTLPSTGPLNILGGTLNLDGFSNTAGLVTLTGGSIVDTVGGGALSGSSYAVQTGAITAVIGGSLSPLTKTGSGTVTLTAANTYGGATVVSAGILNIAAAQTGGGAFSVSDGATLGVNLTAAGQTLNTSSLTLGSSTGASVNFGLGSFGNTTAPVIKTGSLTLNGADIVNISGLGLSVGEIPLIAYTGTVGGSGSFTLGTLPARTLATLDTTSIPNLVQLNVTGFDYPKWTGGVNGNWDLDSTGAGQQGTLNWVTAIGGVATRYLQGTGGTDSVLFDDSAATTATVIGGATTVNLTTTLTPASVSFNNSVLNYIFSGSGALSGAGGLLKQGLGSLTIANSGANSYTGTTTISGGTLQVGDGVTPGAGQLGSGAVVISLGASLVLDRPLGDNFTFANTVSGTGALLQKGGDVVTLTGNNLSFGGSFDVISGTLAVGSVNALGSASGAVEIGATLDVGGFTISNALTINGGALQASSGLAGTVGGPVTLNGSAIGNVASGATLTISGAIGGSGGLTINGGGLLVLAGSSTYSGSTSINAGTLEVGNGGLSGTLGSGPVVDSGTLEFNRTDNYGGAIGNTISGTGGLTLNAGTLALTGANSYGVTTINAGTLQIGAGGVTGTLGGGAVIDNGTLAFNRTDNYGGPVTDAIGGTGGLTLSAGTLVVSGANTYTGITNILGGTLQLGSANALGSGAGVTVVSAGATLDLNGFFTTEQLQIKGGTVTSSSGVSGGVSGAVALSGGGALDVPLSEIVSYSGSISGTGTLTKTSQGTVILSGANTFTGTFTISNGIVDITNSEALGIGPKVINVSNANRPSLELDGSGGAIVIDPSISFSLSSDGGEGTPGAIVNLAGNNTINGPIAMVNGGGGNARVQSLGGTLTLTGVISANGATGVRTLLIGGPGNGVISGAITDGLTNGVAEAVSVSQDGSGSWSLTAANTYSGSTVVDSGTFALSGAGSLTTSLISVYSGALLVLDNTTINSASRISFSPVSLFGGTFDYVSNANGSAQGAGTLTLGSGGSAIVMTGGSGVLTFSSLTTAAGSSMNLSVPGLGTSDVLQFTTAPTLTSGILARVTVSAGGSFDFATYSGANGIVAYTGYNPSTTTNINLAAGTDTVEITSSYGATTLNASKTLNALALNGNGLSVSGLYGAALTLTSGGVLVTGGSDAITVPSLAFGTINGVFSINSGSTLTLASVLTGTGGFVKADGGGLILASPSSNTGATTVNGGVLALAAGLNSLSAGAALTVNGGVVELNGNSQYVGVLNSGGNITGAGGVVDNASPTTSTFAANTGTGTVFFGGQITGNIYFSRAAGSTAASMSLSNNNTYTGGTWLTGGVTTLIDQGALTGTSSITLDEAGLSLSNTGTVNLTNRIPVGAPITMQSATLSLLGRAETASTETVGVVTLAGGLNTINSTVGGTGVNSADLILSGFGITPGTVAGSPDINGSGTVVNFTGTSLGTSGSSSRIAILNGGSQITPAALATEGYLVNNIIPWAVVNGTDFASYVTYTSVNGVNAGGVGALGTAGYGTYDGVTLPSASSPTQNIEITTTQSIPNATSGQVTLTINSLNLSGTVDLNFVNNSDILNLASGGLLRNGAGLDYIGGLTTNNGNLTAGGAQSAGVADLYLYNNQGQLTVDSAIIDNPNGARVRLVISGAGATNLGFNGSSTGLSLYSGGLVVNGGAVNLTGNAVIPGGSIALNATTFSTSNGSTFSSNPSFTLNNSILVLFRSTAVAGLIFNSSGSSGNLVSLSTGVILTLPSDGSGITSNPTSVSTNDIATINGGFVQLNGGAGPLTQAFTVLPTLINGVNVAPSQSGLTINSTIVDGAAPGGIALTGGGVLQLTAANTYTGATTIDAGILNASIIAGINAPSGIGQGSPGGSAADLVFGGGALQYTGASPAITNRLFTIGDANDNSATIDSSSASAANTVSFLATGSIVLTNAAQHTLTLTGSNTGANTFAPVISDQSAGNATSLIKSGLGGWVLTGNNTYSGVTTINAGTLQIGVGGIIGSLGTGAVIDNGTLILDRTDNYGGPLGNTISGSGGLTLLAGTLVLDQAYAYTGSTIVSGGTLTLDFSQTGAPVANIIGSSSALVIGGGVLNVIENAAGADSQTFAGLTLNAGASSISDSNNATGNSLLIALGAITRNTGSTLNLLQPTTAVSATNGFTTTTANSNGILGGWATVGQNWATNNGTNIVAFSGYYMATTGGNTAANYTGQNVQVNSAPVFTSVITPNSFDFANTTARTVTLATGTNIIESGGILVSSAATTAGTLTGGSLTSGNGTDLIVIQNGPANLNIGSVITNNGATAIGLTKTGTGVLNLTAVDTYTGMTRILAGTLQVGVANALPTTGSVILGDAGTNTGGTLNLAGFAQTLLTLSTAGSGPSLVTNSSATAAATLSLTGVGSIFGGVIQDGAKAGGVSLTLFGGGSGTFTGANTYTGLTIVQNYNLTLTGGNNRLSVAAPLELNNNGVLHLGDAIGASNQTLSSLIVSTLGTLNRVVGGNATQTSTLTINNAAADSYQSFLGSGMADTSVVTALNNLALTKTGVGTLTLGGGGLTTALSTYVGGTNINQGTLALGIANALPAANTLTFGAGTLTSGAVNINSGTLDLAGFSSAAGAVTLASGSIIDSVGGGMLNAGSYSVQSGSISAVLNDGGFGSVLTKTTAGTVVLSAADLYDGGTNVIAGTLILGAANALPGAGTATITGGTLALGASNGLAAGGAVNVNGGTLDLAGFSSAAGPVTLTSGSIVNSGSSGATLSASSFTAQSGVVSAALGGAFASFTKTGPGTVTLTAPNTYSGATYVMGGVLNVSATQSGGGSFTVYDGDTLGVDLTAPGQTLAASSLTLGYGTGAAITFNLGSLGNTTAPVINSGSLILSGTDVVNILASGLSVGEFPLIAYSGSIGGSGSLTLGALPARVVATLDTTSIPNLVQLDVTGYDYPKWTGGVNGNWDLDPTGAGQQGTLNWGTAIGGVATRYLQGTGGTDNVLFDDSAAATATVIGGATTVNLTTTLTPVSVTVNNSALNYIFSGSGTLSGSTGLLKEGSGTLTIANTGGNNYTGATTISAGTVQVGDGSTPGAGQLGSGSVSISLGASLVLDRPIGDNFTVVSAFSGAGALVQKGGDTVTLTGNSLSFGGTFDVASGTLAVGSANALGTSTGAIESGATLDVSGFAIGNAITVNGGGLQASSGAGGIVAGPVTLNGGGIANVTSSATLTISGAIAGVGGLAKNGGGALILSGTNTYDGATTINAGTVQIGAGGVVGNLGAGSVIDNGTLVFDRTDSYGGPVNTLISGSGGVTLSAGALILSGSNTYTGVTNLDGGLLNAEILAGVNTSSSIGAGSVAGSAADLVFGGGVLQYTTASVASTNRLFTIGDANGNSATIDSSAADPADTLSFTATGSIALVNSAPHTLILTGSNTGANTFAPVLGDISPAFKTSLIKSGSGTWAISGNNTFTGGVSIQAGTLKLAGANAIGNNLNTVTLGSSVNNTGGALDLNGQTEILVSLSSVGSGQNIVTNSSLTHATLQFAGAGVFGGSIQDGAGGVSTIIYAGASATFTGANTYTGQTLVQNATLILAGTGSTLSANDQVELNNGAGTGGVLVLGNAANSASQTLSSLIIGAGSTNRVIGGNATQTSALTINNSVADAFQGYLGSGTADIFVVTAANDLSLTKTGSGTFTLGGGTAASVSTYDGGTNVNQGTLALGAVNALPAPYTLALGAGTLTSGAVNVNGGTLDLAGFSTVAGAVTLTSGNIVNSGSAATLTGASYAVQSGTVGAALGGSGSSLTKTTAGTVTLSGANTYSGATVVAAGTIVVSGSISGTSSVSVGDGTNAAALVANGPVTTLGGVNLANNGSLSGTGTINGSVTAAAGSTLAPGLSSSGLAINSGSLNLQTGSTLELSIVNSNSGAGGAPALTDYSKLTLGTGVSTTLSGAILVDVTGTLNHLDLFTIILSQTPVIGEFSNTTFVSGSTYAFSSGGADFEINYAYDGSAVTSRSQFQSITDGTEVALLVMPEPNSWTMLLGSLGFALGLQRFRRRKS